jgi:hypothetical protein
MKSSGKQGDEGSKSSSLGTSEQSWLRELVLNPDGRLSQQWVHLLEPGNHFLEKVLM